MSWVTASEVREAINYPNSGAPVSDTNINSFILDAQAEIENIYHTKFGYIETSGTATSGTTGTLVKTSAGWTVNGYQDMIVWIYGGTGVGQYRQITSNTADTLSISPNFDTAPDNTSTYRIITLGYQDETLDGTGKITQFTSYNPLINLNYLSINSTSVTPSKVYKYANSGRLDLSPSAEVTTFLKNQPQLVNMKYVYGVYPFPRIIKRLCIVLAGMRTLSSQIGGSYGAYFSVSLPGLSSNSAQPYTVAQTALKSLQEEAKHIIEEVYRPFDQFG